MVPSATRSRISALKSTSQLCRRTPTPSRQSGTLEGSTFRGNDGEPLHVDLAVGSRVAGLVAGFDRDFGTYAEQLVVPARDTALVPDGLDLVTAPRSRSTAWPQPSSSTCSEPELVEEAVHPARHEVELEGAGDVSDPDARGPRKVLVEAETFDASAGYEPSVATRAFWQAAGFVQVDCIDPPPRWQPGNPSAILVAALDRTR